MSTSPLIEALFHGIQVAALLAAFAILAWQLDKLVRKLRRDGCSPVLCGLLEGVSLSLLVIDLSLVLYFSASFAWGVMS